MKNPYQHLWSVDYDASFTDGAASHEERTHLTGHLVSDRQDIPTVKEHIRQHLKPQGGTLTRLHKATYLGELMTGSMT